MADIQALLAAIQALPGRRVDEVADFVEFIAEREQQDERFRDSAVMRKRRVRRQAA